MTNIREQEARILAKRFANFLQVSSPVHPHPLQFAHCLDFAGFGKCLKGFHSFHFQRLVPCFEKSQRLEVSLAASLCDARFATVQLNLQVTILPWKEEEDPRF